MEQKYLDELKRKKQLHEQEIMTKLRNGEAVYKEDISYISTPKMPESVWTIVRKSNGEFFKRYLDAEKLLLFYEKIARNNTNSEIDIQFRSVAGTDFYGECQAIRDSLQKRLANGQALGFKLIIDDYVEENPTRTQDGTVHLHNIFSVALTEEQTQRYIDVLTNLLETSFQPTMGVPANSMNEDDFYDKALADSIMGRD